MLVASRQCRVKTLSPQVNNLATSLVAVERHPEDPDHLPVTHAWREVVMAMLVENKAAKDAEAQGEDLWTRAKLAKACGTTPSQMLKLLNGTAQSSPLVRRVNEVLAIPFVEPQPISRAQADIIEMMLKVDDLEWLSKTIAMISGDKS